MLDNILPLRPNPREDAAARDNRVKPQDNSRDGSFRKFMNDKRPKKDEEELASIAASEEKEETPSLFDLSKTNKPKNKSTLSGRSAFKESGSSEITQRPVTAKQNQDQDEEPAQDLAQMADSNEETLSTSAAKPPSPKEFYAGAETAETPESLPMEQGIANPQTPQSQMKTLQEQVLPQQPMAVLNQAALQSSQKTKGAKEEGSTLASDKLGGSSKKQKSGKSEEASSKSGASEARNEAAGAINSSIQATAFQTEKTPESQETNRSATIRDIAAQIVDRIQIMRRGDETQTTITLRQPPILEGATITLTASDHAKREFNISFANLSPDAKLLLDRKLKEDSLTQTLERKGIVVHMLTTSTQAEPTFTVDAGQASRDRQDQQQQQQEQQNRQKFQFSEDEEVT